MSGFDKHFFEFYTAQIISHFLFFIAFTIIGLGISILLKIDLRKYNLYSTLCISNILSLGFVVSVFAVYNLGFNTIYIIGLFLYGLFYFCNIEKRASPTWSLLKLDRKECWVLGFIMIAVSLFHLLNFYDGKSPFYTYDLANDYTYYSKISYYLAKSKQENIFHFYNDLMPLKYNGLMLYHYFDLWLNSFFQQFNFFSSIHFTYKLITQSYLQCIVCIGLLGLLKENVKLNNDYYYIVLLPLIAFWGNVDLLSFWHHLDISTYYYSFFYFDPYKLIPITLYLIGVSTVYLKGDTLLALFFLMSVTIVYSVTLPAIFIFLSIVFFISIVWFGLSWKGREILFFLISAVMLFVILFFINSSPKVVSYTSSNLIVDNILYNYKICRNIILGSTLYLFLLNTIPFIVLVANWKYLRIDRRLYNFVILVLLLVFVSMFSWAVFSYKIDSVQLFYTISLPSIAILFLIVFSSIYRNSSSQYTKMTLWFFAIISLSVNVWMLYAGRPRFDENNNDILTFLKENIDNNKIKSFNGIVLYGKKDYVSIYTKNTYAGNIGDILYVHENMFKCINASSFEMPINESDIREKEILEMSYYYNYVKEKAKHDKYLVDTISLGDVKYLDDFIKTHDISFAFVSDNYPYKKVILARTIASKSFTVDGKRMAFCIF